MNSKTNNSKTPSEPTDLEPNITSYYGPEKETEELKKELEKAKEIHRKAGSVDN